MSSAFDTEKASNERFRVTYVEPKVAPPLTDLPEHYLGREEAIEYEQKQIEKGIDPKQLLKDRVLYFRQALYPIRVTDIKTGMIYEVQSDRRTITAKKPDGTLVWKVNPFIDAKLEPYRMKHPYISYFGKTRNSMNLKGSVLGISFTSSQFGIIELEAGKFHWEGQD